MKKYLITLILCFLTIVQTSAYTTSADANDSFVTYNYPDVIVNNKKGILKRSDIYSVEVTQGNKKGNVYVMQDRNSYAMENPESSQARTMTNNNHIANFSFSGNTQVTITRNDGKSIDGSMVYPLEKKYNFKITANKMTITLNSWAYMYVQIPGLEKEPLFIFADKLEDDIPDKSKSEVLNPKMSIEEIKNKINTTGKKCIYFEEGVYSFGNKTGDEYKGFKIPFLSNKKYYIPGGAVIIGSFYNKEGVSNSKLYGRGIITLAGKGRLGSSSSIQYNMFNIGSGTNNIVEGVQFINPSHFCILSRGELKTEFTKMFGWYHQTDGWGAGDNSTLTNSFIKVNDDFIKIYRNNMKVKNVILYKQINGAGVQLGWGRYGAACNCLIEDIYIVNEDDKKPGDISNTAIINLVTNSGSTIKNLTFKNIYADNKVQRLIGLSGNKGTIKNITIENVYLKKGTISPTNYIATHNDTKYSGLSFINLNYGQDKIKTTEQFGMKQYLLKSKKEIQDKNYHLTDIIIK